MIFAVLVTLVGVSESRADIVVTGAFGPNGDINSSANSPAGLGLTFGASNQGFLGPDFGQLDAFVNVAGQNLNNTGSGFGTSADLSYGSPTGLGFQFSSSQPTTHQLLLSYQFVNSTGVDLPGFQLLSLVDAGIGSNFADESATTAGALGNGHFGSGASSFQVGDPSSSTLYTNLSSGTLSNVNELSSPTSGDVAIGLGLQFGTLHAGQSVGFLVLLSDDGSNLGGLVVTQTDPVFLNTTLTVSARVVPEPSALIQLAIGLLSLPAIGYIRWTHRKPDAS